MNNSSLLLLKPPILRGIITLSQQERSLFQQSIPLKAISLVPTKIRDLLSALSPATVLDLPRIRHIVPAATDQEKRLILLAKAPDQLLPQDLEAISRCQGTLVDYALKIDYAYWSVSQVLEAILPEGIPIPSSFETVGHIAHINLLQEHIPFKALIGQVILDKNPTLKTVVNKIGNIENEFRVFPMEVIAGEADLLVAQVKEQQCTFRFDFSKVYWNSRLHAEHERLVERHFQKGQRICDVFAGVGPFTIPAAKRKSCTVYANDLNPQSFYWLQENVKTNKVQPLVRTFNEDAVDFIPNSLKYLRTEEESVHFDHYILNLPAIATSFLKYFPAGEVEGIVHCYLFVKDVEGEEVQDPVAVVKAAVSGRSIEVVDVHSVRSVAPLKTMYCVSFCFGRESASKRQSR